MYSIRFTKIWTELRSHKLRSILAILAMSLGILGATSVINTYSILQPALQQGYLKTNPASATLVSEDLDQDLLKQIKALPYIEDAESMRVVRANIKTGQKTNPWMNIILYVRNDFNHINIDKINPIQGSWPADINEIIIEQSSLSLLDSQLNDFVTIKTQHAGKITTETQLKFTGIAQESGLAPAWMEHSVYGYIHQQTLPTLQQPITFNQLKITVSGNRLSEKHVHQQVNKLKTWLQQKNRKVYDMHVPKPNRHIHAAQMESFLYLQATFGILAFILSGILIIKMISAVLSGQVRQIAVMKAIGASQSQIFLLYTYLVIILGFCAALLTLPLSNWISSQYATYLAQLLNFNTDGKGVSWLILLVEFVFALLLPILVASLHIYQASRKPVKDSLNEYGVSQDNFGQSKLDYFISQIKFLNASTMLGLRNTIRQKSRLILTLITLSIGGAIFIAALNTRASIKASVFNVLQMNKYDQVVIFKDYYDKQKLHTIANSLINITAYDSWVKHKAAFVNSDGSLSNTFNLEALSPDSDMVDYIVADGRWLKKDDKNVVVINQQIAQQQKLQVGDNITIAVSHTEQQWQVVGIVSSALNAKFVYVNENYYLDLIKQTNQANTLTFITEHNHHSNSTQSQQQLKQLFESQGFKVASTYNLKTLIPIVEDHILMALNLMFLMAILIVLVASFAIVSSMSINVTERRKEIAVMRAIGASNKNIAQVIYTEGLFIGFLSWLIAIIISYPATTLLGTAFTSNVFRMPLILQSDLFAILIWLPIIAVLCLLACYLPSKKAFNQAAHEDLSLS